MDVNELEFYVSGDADAKLDSQIQVYSKGTTLHGLPEEGGLMDASMGTTDYAWKCSTCRGTKIQCPSHFGHLLLRYPFQNPLYLDIVIKWLKILCLNCANLIMKQTGKIHNFEMCVEQTKSQLKNVKCVHCQVVHPKIGKTSASVLNLELIYYKSDMKTVDSTVFLNNDKILSLFKRIPPHVLKLFNITEKTHPKNMISYNLRVSPIALRPDTKNYDNRQKNNDTTTILRTIVQINDGLPVLIPEVIPQKLLDSYTSLCISISSMIKETNSSGLTVNNGNTPSGLLKRLEGKTGLIRNNLDGKRVFGSARGVITADSTLKVDQLGIPVSMAKDIQIPEVVNPHNREKLELCFRNGLKYYPGCTSVIKKDSSKTHSIKNRGNYQLVLEEGDTLVRDILDGDAVMMGRSPSLRDGNMSAHTAKVFKDGMSIRLNISACNLYDADFDGDCVQLHFPKTTQTSYEIIKMAGVASKTLSRQNGGQFIGCIQDTVAGTTELTRDAVLVNRFDAMALCAVRGEPKEVFTGREIFSMILPKIVYSGNSSHYNPAYEPYITFSKTETSVAISDTLSSGIIDYNSIGKEKSTNILRTITRDYGGERCLDFIFKTQKLASDFLFNSGFSINLDDIFITDPKILDQLHRKIQDIILKSALFSENLKNGRIIPSIGVSLKDFYEQQQMALLSMADDFIGTILSSINPKENRLYTMIQHCKKGNINQFQSMTASIGSTIIGGHRIKPNFGYERTTAYFTRYDLTPEANGFIVDSFGVGISPSSFIFSAQEARYGVINKALSTSVAGDNSRQWRLNMESIRCDNMRKSVGSSRIIQFLYGGIGMDTRFLEKISNPIVELSDKEFSKYRLTGSPEDQKFFDMDFEWLSGSRKWLRPLLLQAEYLTEKAFSNSMVTPVHTLEIIKSNTDGDGEVNVKESMLIIMELTNRIPYLYINDNYYKKNGTISEIFSVASRYLISSIRCHLNMFNIVKYKLNIKSLKVISDAIITAIVRALIDSGTAVGLIATQSLAQPLSQEIISSHHKSGAGGVQGEQQDTLSRLNEVLKAKPTESMSYPYMIVHVLPEYGANKVEVEKIAKSIEGIQIEKLLKRMDILFEPHQKIVHPMFKSDIEMISAFSKFNPDIIAPSDLISWVIRLELNISKMILKNMEFEYVVASIKDIFPKMYIVHSFGNSDNIVIRCYIRNSMIIKKRTIDLETILELAQKLIRLNLRGVGGISATQVIQITKSQIIEDGAIKKNSVFAIRTRGTNLRDISYINGVDINRTYSNSIKEMEKYFGIAVAKVKFGHELAKLIRDVAATHYHMFSDVVSSTGVITSLNLKGVKQREPNNVLLHLAYSHIIANLKSASTFNYKCAASGLSADLMLGRAPRYGTLYNTISIDREFVEANTQSLASVLDDL